MPEWRRISEGEFVDYKTSINTGEDTLPGLLVYWDHGESGFI